MDKKEYIDRLSNALDPYDIPNKYEILADYEQIVDEILLDNNTDFNEVINKIGYPEILALEIVEELGYEPKEQNKKTDEELDKNRYNVKRQNTNVLWNLLLAIHWLFQAGFIIALVIITSITFYFGIDAKLNVEGTLKDDVYKSELRICKKDEKNCQKINLEHPLFKDDNRQFFNYKYESHNTTINDLPIGLFGLTSSIILVVLIVLNYSIIYRPTKRIILRNQQYNRRRNYE